MRPSARARANRRNARRSTGPKTPAGKAAVALNALRHGLAIRGREGQDFRSGLVEADREHFGRKRGGGPRPANASQRVRRGEPAAVGKP